ncbi:MAG: hypothetical protein WD602_00495 [Actinomycetota bacterium]
MKNSKLVGIVATVLVAAAVIAGLFAVGSPNTARELRADDQRRQDLTELHFELSQHRINEGSLPDSLEELDSINRYSRSFDPRRDPETGEFFEYTKLSDSQYEVCAVFNASIDDAEGYRGFSEIEHDAGRNCYERDAGEGQSGSDFFPPERPSPVRPKAED